MQLRIGVIDHLVHLEAQIVVLVRQGLGKVLLENTESELAR